MKNTFNSKILTFVALMTFLSCSSPSEDGKKAAKAENQCATECLESIQQLESDFVSEFDADDYTYRADALKEYNKRFKELGEEYDENIAEATIQTSQLKGRYSDNYQDLEEFDAMYYATKDYDLQASATSALMANTIPPAVIASINKIIPPKPDVNQIMADFSGHSIKEGLERKDCYFSEQWSRTFGDEVSVSNLNIEDVSCEDNHEYVFTAAFVMKEGHLSYNAKACIHYTLPSGEDWKLDYIKSLGVRIIQTHKYDDYIRCEIDEDGWGGTNALFISNTSEIQLLVIGHIQAGYNKEQSTFCKPIPAGSKVQVGGLFAGGSVEDYDIILVERL